MPSPSQRWFRGGTSGKRGGLLFQLTNRVRVGEIGVIEIVPDMISAVAVDLEPMGAPSGSTYQHDRDQAAREGRIVCHSFGCSGLRLISWRLTFLATLLRRVQLGASFPPCSSRNLHALMMSSAAGQ
jgi:hypothetical protein